MHGDICQYHACGMRHVPPLHYTTYALRKLATYARLCLGNSLHSSSVSLLVEKMPDLPVDFPLGLLSAGR